MTRTRVKAALVYISTALATPALAQDATGCLDHGAITRYPGSVLQGCKTDNYLPYKVPMGPVTDYRTIGEWIETEGRVTRNFYSLTGGERTHPEVWKNYQDALVAAGFEIIAEGMFAERNVKGDIGRGSWLSVYYIANPWGENGAVNKLVTGKLFERRNWRCLWQEGTRRRYDLRTRFTGTTFQRRSGHANRRC